MKTSTTPKPDELDSQENGWTAKHAPMDLIDAVRAANDRLGRYSDHEGNEDGSTFFFWKKGRLKFGEQCQRAIRDHEAAIVAWRYLQSANESRLRNRADRGQQK